MDFLQLPFRLLNGNGIYVLDKKKQKANIVMDSKFDVLDKNHELTTLSGLVLPLRNIQMKGVSNN
jgi:hypothetical protein